MPSMFSRLFTVEEANALLSALRPLIEEILAHVKQLKAKSQVVVQNQRLSPDSPNFMDRLQQDTEIARLIQQIKAGVEEIQSWGCVCKGIEQGLVDFPCLLGGEVVFLCWRYGEQGVLYWHRIEDGYAGRRPLLDPDENDPGNSSSYH